MTSDLIEKFIESKAQKHGKANIHFKQRATLKGLFLKSTDYEELKSKNFWRIVTEAKIAEFEKTKDLNLARIFNGAEFTRLSELAK